MTHHSSSPCFQAPGSASMKSRACRSEGGAVIRGHRSFMGKKCDLSFPQETAMIRSRTVNKIHELAAQGKSIQDIAIQLGIARNTVRKYLRHPELVAMPHPRPNRRSKLDPFKEQVRRWITED